MNEQRGAVVRAALAALVVVAVLVMVVLDQRSGSAPTAGAPDATGTSSPQHLRTPIDPTTQLPRPDKGSPSVTWPDLGKTQKKRRADTGTRRGSLPQPPQGLDRLVCRQFSPGPVRLTVLSFNMHRGHAGLGRVAATIARTGADVVLLQEVDRFVGRTGNTDHTQVLARRLGMRGVFGANIRRGGGTYGTAILSRHRILEWQNTPLPNDAKSEQRGLLRATIRVKGRRIRLYNTHLQFGPSPLQKVQAAAVKRTLAADPMPKILGGDLNFWPTSRAMGALVGPVRDPWPSVGVGPGGTGPNGGRIDYVMPSAEIRALHSVVVRTPASDHHAVRTQLQLPAPPCPA